MISQTQQRNPFAALFRRPNGSKDRASGKQSRLYYSLAAFQRDLIFSSGGKPGMWVYISGVHFVRDETEGGCHCNLTGAKWTLGPIYESFRGCSPRFRQFDGAWSAHVEGSIGLRWIWVHENVERILNCSFTLPLIFETVILRFFYITISRTSTWSLLIFKRHDLQTLRLIKLFRKKKEKLNRISLKEQGNSLIVQHRISTGDLPFLQPNY